jgi:hypothetical protein
VSVLLALSIAAVADVAKLIAAQSNSRSATQSEDAGWFVLRRIALRRSRPIAKGWL